MRCGLFLRRGENKTRIKILAQENEEKEGDELALREELKLCCRCVNYVVYKYARGGAMTKVCA